MTALLFAGTLVLWTTAAYLALVPFATTAAPPAAARPVLLVDLDGAISPVLAEHLGAALKRAARDQAQLVVVRIDTPGGLDTAMRSIIKDILASPVPVAAFVSPAGARAASAGTFILYASHIAAMAPGTNVGAATPIAIGTTDQQKTDAGSAKAVNDAAAYLRSLALLRGRNADWGERAVRHADSLPAEAALKLKVIDLIAPDLPTLLQTLDGRSVPTGQHEVRLQLSGAPLQAFAKSWRVRVLAVLSDPGIALLLVMLGLAGLFLELSSPGLLLPGMLGAVSLLLGMYALQMLPLDFAGIALLLIGIALLVAEIFMPSGLLAAGGALALVAAAVMLSDSGVPGTLFPPALIVGLAALLALAMAAGVSFAVRSRRLPVQDSSALIGAVATLVDTGPGAHWAEVRGERWQVVSDHPLQPGQQVQVVARDGLTLQVVPVGSHNHRSSR